MYHRSFISSPKNDPLTCKILRNEVAHDVFLFLPLHNTPLHSLLFVRYDKFPVTGGFRYRYTGEG